MYPGLRLYNRPGSSSSHFFRLEIFTIHIFGGPQIQNNLTKRPRCPFLNYLIKEQAPLKDFISHHCIIGLKQMGDFQKDKEALYDQPDHKIPVFFTVRRGQVKMCVCVCRHDAWY